MAKDEKDRVEELAKHSWASVLMNAILVCYEQGNLTMPKGLRLKGVNMVEREDKDIVVGFVITRKEG